jgi:hypothetical protein
VDFCVSEASGAFIDNVAAFVRHQLSRHGALAAAARALQVDPAKLRRYASRRGSLRELRDIQFIYRVIEVMGFDPATVFSAAQRSSSLATLLALAEGSLEHRMSPEMQRLGAARDPDHGRHRSHLELASSNGHDFKSDVA